MTFVLDTDLLSLDRLDPGREHRMQLDPDAWTRGQRAADQPITGVATVARDFTYDTSRDSINYNVDAAGPTSITIHWWGTPAYYRDGSPEGTLAWLTGITGNRGSSAHYVATVITSSRQSIVYQIIADSDAAWHAGHPDANWNSLGIEMMPWDASTPAWQRDALLELAAELVASLWHRWPGLRNKPLKGHSDWYNTECPGSYYPRLGDIYKRAQQLYPLYAGNFGQFNKAAGGPSPAPTPTPITEQTHDEEIEMNSGIYWLDGKVYNYLTFNTNSGWGHRFNNGTGGPLSGSYLNPIAAALRTGSFAKVSKSQAMAIIASLNEVRTVKLSGAVTIEGEQE